MKDKGDEDSNTPKANRWVMAGLSAFLLIPATSIIVYSFKSHPSFRRDEAVTKNSFPVKLASGSYTSAIERSIAAKLDEFAAPLGEPLEDEPRLYRGAACPEKTIYAVPGEPLFVSQDRDFNEKLKRIIQSDHNIRERSGMSYVERISDLAEFDILFSEAMQHTKSIHESCSLGRMSETFKLLMSDKSRWYSMSQCHRDFVLAYYAASRMKEIRRIKECRLRRT